MARFCSHCGKEIHEDAVICVHCGCSVAQYNSANPVTLDPNDAPNFGIAVLGFFIPLVGLILYCVWKQTKPKAAASAGKGALIGFIISVVSYLLMFMIPLFTTLMD